jgi:hypothetical protein
MIFFKSVVLVLVMVMAAFLGPIAAAEEAQPLGSLTISEDAQLSVVLGWNFVNPNFCYFSGTALVVFGLDGNLWAVTDAGAQNLISPSCSAGTRIAFHVVDISGLFDAVIAYPFK